MHQPDYLPWQGYFNKIVSSDAFVFFDTAFYSHSGFHDSNKIKTAQGSAYLTIPTEHTEDFKRLLDVRLPKDSRWSRKHLRSLEIHYGRAPYWAEHAPFFREVYDSVDSIGLLIELNIRIIEYICSSFGIQTPLYRASVLGADMSLRSTEAIIQVIQNVGATEFLAGTSGKKYLDAAKFEAAGIRLHFQEYHERERRQLFPPFLPGLTAIDLLCNEGRGGREYLL